jgi:hypothetical protein
LKDNGRRDYTLNSTTLGPTNGGQFISPFFAGQFGNNKLGRVQREGGNDAVSGAVL